MTHSSSGLKRYIILGSSVLIQMILGSIYAWSTIAQALQTDRGFNSFQTQLIFGTVIFVFSFTLILGGKMFRTYGPKITVSLAALLFLAGYSLGGLSAGFIQNLLSIGLIMGMSIGLGYACPLSTGVAWFPNHKGFITGISVFGFGAGSIFANWFLTRALQGGTPVSSLLMGMGIAGGLVILLSAQVLDLPHTYAATVSRNALPVAPRFLVKNTTFWRLAIGMAAGTFPGLIIIGRVGSIALDNGFGTSIYSSIPVMALTFVALGNATGRLFWGWLNDILQEKTIVLSLILTSVTSFFLITPGTEPWVFLTLIYASGFLFGGSLVLYAANTARFFGNGSLATVYPYIFVFYGIAALVGPTIGGRLYDLGGSNTPGLTLAGLIPLLGLLAIQISQRNDSDNLATEGAS